MEKITIEFILIGQAVPEERKDRRISQCTAGYSPTLKSLIRIYPIPHQVKLKRWTLYEIDVERNPKDVRNESWKIQGSKTHWDNAPDRIREIRKLLREEWIALIESIAQETCTVDLNQQRDSLAIIKPIIIDAYIHENEVLDSSKTHQITLIEGKRLPKTGKGSSHSLRIKYSSSFCKLKGHHDQHVLEYGVYTWIFKHPNDETGMEKVIDNLRLHDNEYEKYFLIGNINRFKKSWVIISVIRWKK